MALTDPVVAYVAANNIEANLLKVLLVDAGVEAFASEDLSTAGLWAFGLLPFIHRPQVWVSRADLERARMLVEEFESQAEERERTSEAASLADDSPIAVVCEDCKEGSVFPAALRGTIQDCPHCGAYLDVGEVEPFWEQGKDADA